MLADVAYKNIKQSLISNPELAVLFGLEVHPSRGTPTLDDVLEALSRKDAEEATRLVRQLRELWAAAVRLSLTLRSCSISNAGSSFLVTFWCRNRQIDKAFSHRLADAKSGLDEALRRGVGERGDGKAEGGNSVSRGWASAGHVSEKWTTMRAARSRPRPLGVENAAQDMPIGVSGYRR
jgi:hypothetical protein